MPDIRPQVCQDEDCSLVVTGGMSWVAQHNDDRMTMSYADLKSGAVHPIDDVQAWAESLHA